MFSERLTPMEGEAQTDAAFTAIRLLYCASLPLWKACKRPPCKRHRRCCGQSRACLAHGWKLMPEAVQPAAWDEVKRGGPRRLPPASAIERDLRRFPPTNFVL